MNMPARLVVLISGNGSNLQSILDACLRHELPASVAAVISSRPDAHGLSRARDAGVEAIYFPRLENESRREHDARLAQVVESLNPDLVILAGWMRILTSAFIDRFPNRIINLHPALPGTFPGTHAIQRAYAAWQKGEVARTGVMVHLVPDEGVDDGPVLATQEIEFVPGESLDDFAMRVHEVEHELLLKTLKNILTAKAAK
jgi:phosphoribosylglycinamide formyltransferase-1